MLALISSRARALSTRRAVSSTLPWLRSKSSVQFAAACLSPFHFVRMFKQSFGLSPHAWVMQRRLAKARALLRAAGMAEVGAIPNAVRLLHPRHRVYLVPRAGDLVVVGANGIADYRVLLVFLGQLHSDDGMGLFEFFRPDLSDVMEQSGAFGLLHVKAQFRGHDGTEVCHFPRVLQKVLTIR